MLRSSGLKLIYVIISKVGEQVDALNEENFQAAAALGEALVFLNVTGMMAPDLDAALDAADAECQETGRCGVLVYLCR